ncbi:50S ribosomal protein L17 [Candidatus Saccharibacteria bacterium]|nr:50S ribosomal protein L17 [Candidatus Saccharibacteria bacterium]NCU40612.1 50S ribosomal protein L17 [Candidatus Saccharibacteria bacterium]
MHRHGYKGRKFRRETDQRRALIKGLVTNLVDHGTIETTLPKAKEIVPYAERLITKAKKGGLHNRRQVIAGLLNLDTARKLFDEIAPKLILRNSGHLRIVRTRLRVGDNAQMARVEFVDDVYESVVKAEPSKAQIEKVEPKKADNKTARAAAPKAVKAVDKHLSQKPVSTVRKSGER